MKTLAILLMLTTNAFAEFNNNNDIPDTNGNVEGGWTCKVIKITPKEKYQSDPFNEVNLYIRTNNADEVVGMNVTWVSVQGRERDRSEQYTRDQKVKQYPSGTVEWFGRIGDRPGNWTMTGTFNPRTRTYNETVNGTYIETKCRKDRG